MKRRQRGLTLVELMVTLAAAIILLAVGLPFFGGVVANNRAAAQANALVTALNLARSESVARAENVSVRHAGADWEDGWNVFVDDDADGVLDGGEQVLRRWEAQAANSSISLSSGNAVTFDFNGAASTPVDFELDQTDATGLIRRCVTVTGTGQIRTKREKGGEAWSCP